MKENVESAGLPEKISDNQVLEFFALLQQQVNCAAVATSESESAANDSISIVDLQESINALSASILKASGSGFVDALFVAIAGGLAGAIAAVVFSHLHWKTVNKRESLSLLATSLQDIVLELETVSIKYWLVDAKEQIPSENQTSEIRIKSCMKLVTRYARILSSFQLKGEQAKLVTQVVDFQDNIYDIATGDEFESSARVASPEKATKISYKCSALRASLTELAIRP